ncbi:uncharacterized protein LOC135480392 [Liolophura sinensis]|uniref:uncharacterized protein LOC135480392 n=1 Tax=Liolophura sinensis TaxID=3198878 RepID=UPI003158D98C
MFGFVHKQERFNNMAGWHSLSGDLQYRTGGGLSILKPKKKLWFVLEESKCQLKFYNSEAEARKKPPIGQIDLKGAAISLDLEQQNQFIIIANSKDHIFTAENHESLMIWLIGLQAKRDACLQRSVSRPELRGCSSLPLQGFDSQKRRSSDFIGHPMFRKDNEHEQLRRSNTIGSNHGIQPPRRNMRQADSLDSVLESCERVNEYYIVNRSRSLPPLMEVVSESSLRNHKSRQLSRSVTEEDCISPETNHDQLWLRRDSNSSGCLSQQEDNDDVFRENVREIGLLRTSEEKLKLLRQNHVSTVDVLTDCSSKNCVTAMSGHERTSSCSGLSSGSTDSAIDKGPPDPQQEMLIRMADLEQELIATKCELAKVLNQQTFFHDMLEKKDAIIHELDQTLDQLGVADIKRQMLYGGKFMSTKKGKALQETVRVLTNQNRFLNEEIRRLAKIRQSEQDKYREQEDRLRHYEAEIEGWKRNYVCIVQSCIHYPTGDSMDGAEVTLYGEERHKATVKGLLSEARRTNPSLPTFERLAGSPHHVDNYGFKHSHQNTGLLLHYICQQLNQHYTMQLANYEHHQLRWKDFLCQHREFDRSDKELKQLCRGGIPHQYRKEVWRRLVYSQVDDLRKEKGPHFFRNLCNSLPDSQSLLGPLWPYMRRFVRYLAECNGFYQSLLGPLWPYMRRFVRYLVPVPIGSPMAIHEEVCQVPSRVQWFIPVPIGSPMAIHEEVCQIPSRVQWFLPVPIGSPMAIHEEVCQVPIRVQWFPPVPIGSAMAIHEEVCQIPSRVQWFIPVPIGSAMAIHEEVCQVPSRVQWFIPVPIGSPMAIHEEVCQIPSRVQWFPPVPIGSPMAIHEEVCQIPIRVQWFPPVHIGSAMAIHEEVCQVPIRVQWFPPVPIGSPMAIHEEVCQIPSRVQWFPPVPIGYPMAIHEEVCQIPSRVQWFPPVPVGSTMAMHEEVCQVPIRVQWFPPVPIGSPMAIHVEVCQIPIRVQWFPPVPIGSPMAIHEELAARYRKQISLDLMRTMPSNVKFSSPGSKGIHDLQDVLLAFCIHNPSVGYCQGLNFIVAMSLLIMEPPDAFWTLVAVTEKYFSPNYFNHNLIGAQADQEVLREIILDKLPKLCHHLEDIDIEISTVTLNWFMAIFFEAVPFETLLRIWDCFLLEGPKVLFRFSLAILKVHQHDLLQKTDTISVMRHLKACAKLTYDIDGLIKTAFEELAPFPSRRDISIKQACYLNVLKDKYKKREWHRRAYVEREQMLLEQKADSENAMLIECVAEYDEGKLWLCHSENNISKVCKVNCSENMMYNLALEFESRVLCMTALRTDIMLIGTVAWSLLAFDTRSREQKWELQLHDAVLSLCVLKDGKQCRVFAALADGTLAVLENVGSSLPKLDVFYVPVGKSSVTSMSLLNDQLWCASGNMVYVLHARTLDPMDNFTVSANPYDQVLSLVPGEFGMWISLKGSSILELWDTKGLSCKMLYDTRAGRYPNLRKEDDSYFNKARITSIYSHGNTVMVGTGDGVLITFEVVERLPTKSSPDGSQCSESRSSSPFYISNPREPHSSVSLNSVNDAKDKVKEYFERLEMPLYQREITSMDENLAWEPNLECSSPRTDVLRDFDTISYPSSLACSEISNSISMHDSSVQSKGDNSDSEQGQVLRAETRIVEEGRELLLAQDFVTQDCPSPSTPTADGLTLFNKNDLERQDNINDSGLKGETAEVVKTTVHGKYICQENGSDTCIVPQENNPNANVVDDNLNNNNNNIPKININGEHVVSEKETGGSTSEENSLFASVTSNESFRTCEDKNDNVKDVSEITVDSSSNDFVSCTGNSEDIFEDEVFYEAMNEAASNNDKPAEKPSELTVNETSRPRSPGQSKDKLRSRPLKIRKRSKKLTSEVQYRLDFSDMKVSIDSTVSSSSFSERRSSLMSNWYPSDSSLDQLKSSLRGDNSCSMSQLYTKPSEKIAMATTPPIIIASHKTNQFLEMSAFKRVSSSDTHMDSVGLSSLEDMSSHKECESSEAKGQLGVGRVQISHNSSSTSLCSLTEAQLYAFDLVLQAKVKISDKPVKCLLPTSVKQETVIVSCAGCHGDDEAVLRWRKDGNEKIWTNEPIYEICQTTNKAKLPTYMRNSVSSSQSSSESRTSSSSVVALNNI